MKLLTVLLCVVMFLGIIGCDQAVTETTGEDSTPASTSGSNGLSPSEVSALQNMLIGTLGQSAAVWR